MVARSLLAARDFDRVTRARPPRPWLGSWPPVKRPVGERARLSLALRVRVRSRRARRGHAPARPGRGPDPHRPHVPRLGGRRRVQRRPRAAPVLRAADRRRHRAGRQRGGSVGRGPDAPGRRRRVAPHLAPVRRHRPNRAQRAELHRARLRGTRRDRRRPTAATPPPPNSTPATSTGTTCSERWGRAGFTRAGSTPRCPSPARGSPRRRCGPRGGTGRSSRTTSTTVRACGRAAVDVEAARAVNRALVPHVDVMLGNEEDFTACLGFEVDGVADATSPIWTRRRSGR